MSKKENVKGQQYPLHIMQHFLQMLASTVLSINEEISTYRCQVHSSRVFTLIEIYFYFQVEDLLKRLDYVENDWNVLAKAPRRFGVSVTVPVGIFVLLIM